jgi:hypothetical protein
MFQLAVGQAAATALAQNNGTRYIVGNIYDTICKYQLLPPSRREANITKRKN